MASSYDGLARIIIQNVGGTENIESVFHCVTRLRFHLKDESKADTKTLEKTKGVIKVVNANGQYQVVIGPAVNDVYDAVLAVGHLSGAGEVDEDGNPIAGTSGTAKKKTLVAGLIDIVSGIIQPSLGVLAAAGMLKGILALLTFLGVMTTSDGAYNVLYAVSDGFFYFLPIILGYTSAKKFHCNEFIGLAMGIALTYPTMVNSTDLPVLGTVFAGTPFAMDYHMTFCGLPIVMPAARYTSSVVPIILSMFVVSKIERFMKNHMPSTISFFMTPLLTLAIGATLTYLIIGPVASFLTSCVLLAFNTLYNLPMVGGLVAGTVLGGVWQVLVMFGLHQAILPLRLVNLNLQGFDTIIPPNFTCVFAQVAVVFAIWIKTRDQHVKDVALPSMITGFFGTTEPAIYGITLPRMKPFVFSCIAGAVGGAIIGGLGTKMFVASYAGFMGLSQFIDPSGAEGVSNLINVVIASLIAMAIGFVLTWFFWDEKKWSAEAENA